MNQREIVLSALVVICLTFTVVILMQHKVYDCTQPLFSKHSSCSLTGGGGCIKTNTKPGLKGLWSYFTQLELREDPDGFTVSCSSDCAIRFEKSGLQQGDTVTHVAVGAYCH